MRRFAAILLFAIVLGIPVRPAAGYSFQYTGAARPTPLHWSARTVAISLSSSLFDAQSNIKAGSDVAGAIRRSLDRWEEASGFEFRESVVKDDSISPATGGGDGRNLITVAPTAENLTPFEGGNAEMPARTRVFFARNGSITEADIALNPYQQFSTDGTPGTYDLESTLTHELGHLLGLEHSSVIGATMQPRQARNGLYGLPAIATRTLSEDDRAGVRALYPGKTSRDLLLGSLSGTITRRNERAVFGANVWLADAATGRFIAASATEADGSYEFTGLRSGDYRVSVESLDGPIGLDELASQRGPYARLGQNPVRFGATELQVVSVGDNGRVKVNGTVSGGRSGLNPYLIGFNGQLSTVPVPVTPGRTYRILLGGEGLDPKNLAASGVAIDSPFLTVNPSSIVPQQFGPHLSVISFDVNVAADAPQGEYSIRVISAAGETAYLTAGLTIDGTVNPWQVYTF